MAITVEFAKPGIIKADALVLCVYRDKKLDKKAHDFIRHAVETRKNFKGKLGETMLISLSAEAPYPQAVILGLGDPAKFGALQAESAGGKLYAALASYGITSAALYPPAGSKKFSGEECAAALASGARLRSYAFETYKSKKTDPKDSFGKLTLLVENPASARKTYNAFEGVAAGVFLARDMVNEPPNVLYPESFVEIARKELAPLGVEIEVIDDKKMEKLGMGAILAVGKGSARKPRMLIMRWNGKKASKDAPLAFVGKGVTFDTGGISIKPGPGMEEMKMDMGGAAAVTGLMKALATRKAKVNVVAVAGLAENMPSDNAYRPADILKSYSGKTIEVLNTDAEGRLVLADCLTYVQKTYKPRLIIDLATLTGAMIVALGHEYCGAFVNDDKLWKQLQGASKGTGEKLWRMPLDELWRKEMEGSMTDLQNMARSGRDAGSCTAAGFLEHFIEGNTPWAHLDIAGTAWRKSDQPTVPKFGTGYGVRLLNQFVADNFE